MVRISLFHILVVTLTCVSYIATGDRKNRLKNDSPEKSLWKKEYEDELTDAMLSSKKDNFTRVAQSVHMPDNEMVVEKLMDSITSSEKYLKKVDSVDFRLNRLDIEVHEKTNDILKRLTEIMKVIQTHPYEEKTDVAIDSIKSDLTHIRSILEHTPRAGSNNKVDGADLRIDSNLDTRLTFLESNVKVILNNVESIAGVISEVKNRQYSRSSHKSEPEGLDALNLVSEFRRALQDQKSRKCDCRSVRAERSERYPTDCYEIQMQGFNVSGIYKIKPDDMEPFYALCDLNTAGGGWTVIQNRFDGSQDFYKRWPEYKHGFGNLAGEFWLGLEKLNYLTNQKLYELRIELESQLGQEAYAVYSVFTIGAEHEGYRISTLGSFHGSAGDSLSYHAGQKFSTYDDDNDEWKDGSCAIEHGGAWWYKECDKSNLNGKYSLTAEEQQGQSIYWISFKGPTTPLTKTRMMIRPLPASRPIDYSGHTKKVDAPKQRPISDKGIHKNEQKLGRAPYRYEDTGRSEAFFPNYA